MSQQVIGWSVNRDYQVWLSKLYTGKEKKTKVKVRGYKLGSQKGDVSKAMANTCKAPEKEPRNKLGQY